MATSLLARAMGTGYHMGVGAIAGALMGATFSDSNAGLLGSMAAGAAFPFGLRSMAVAGTAGYIVGGGEHPYLAMAGLGLYGGAKLGGAIGRSVDARLARRARAATNIGVGHTLQYAAFPRASGWGVRSVPTPGFARPSSTRVMAGSYIGGASVGLGLAGLAAVGHKVASRDGFGGGNGFGEDTMHFVARGAQLGAAVQFGLPLVAAATAYGHHRHGFSRITQAASWLSRRSYPTLTLFGGALLASSFAGAVSGAQNTEIRSGAQYARSMPHDHLNTQDLGLALHYARGR